MKSISDGYYQDLLLATLLRIWFTLGIVSIIAILSSGCTRGTEVESSLSREDAAHGLFNRGETDQTRNRFPQGGCDEKSDRSLTGPDRRLD